MKTLHLDEVEANVLIKHYSKELEALDERRNSIKKILVQLNSSVENKKNDCNRGESSIINGLFAVSDYNLDWTWTQKIEYVLKKENHIMTKNQIMELLRILDKEIDSNFKAAGNSVGATLSRQTKNGKFMLYEEADTQFNAYALPEWYENGKLKIEHS